MSAAAYTFNFDMLGAIERGQGPPARSAAEALNDLDRGESDSSTVENPLWHRRFRARRRAEEQIDLYERSPEHSPPPRPGEHFYEDQLRARIAAGRPARRRGTGWEDRVAAAEGEAITNAIYGPSDEVLDNTSLTHPAIPFSRVPQAGHRLPNARSRQREWRSQIDEEMRESMDLLQTYRVSLAYQRRAVEAIEQLEDELEAHRRLTPRLEDKVAARVAKWRQRDPNSAILKEWIDFCKVAVNCSDSKVRQFNIMTFFIRGVPQRLCDAVQALEEHYTQEARLKDSILFHEVDAELRDLPPSYGYLDDNVWSAICHNHPFGWCSDNYGRPDAIPNGFDDYVPKGEGVECVRHFIANFTARKVRLEHAGPAEFEQHEPAVDRFVNKALSHFTAMAHDSSDPLIERSASLARNMLLEYQANPLLFMPRAEDGIDRTPEDSETEDDDAPLPPASTRPIAAPETDYGSNEPVNAGINELQEALMEVIDAENDE